MCPNIKYVLQWSISLNLDQPNRNLPIGLIVGTSGSECYSTRLFSCWLPHKMGELPHQRVLCQSAYHYPFLVKGSLTNYKGS